MSHSVKLVIALNTEIELAICNEVEDKLNTFPKSYNEYFASEFKDIKLSIQELKSYINEIKDISFDSDLGRDFVYNYQRKLDSITKKIQNIKSINISEYIKKYDIKQNSEINKIIADNGIMATLAIQEIRAEHVEVTSKSLLNKINYMRNKSYEDEKLKTELKELETFIFDQEYDESIEDYFLSLLNNSNSPQLIMDLHSLISYKKKWSITNQKVISTNYKNIRRIII